MIEVSDLEKSYGEVKALRGVSFQVGEGEIIGLLGPNGAGKSTIIKTLTGYLQPDFGDVLINGLDVMTETAETQSLIGYLPENAPLYPELTVYEYLDMMGNLRQIPREDLLTFLSEAVHATGLQNHINRPISQLSKGYRQRVGLAQAILHKPRLLILDEPTVGLDPTQIVEIRNLIRRLSAESTILFSTHILPEVEALCDRVLMLINGRIKLNAGLSEISLTNDVILTLASPPKDLSKRLGELAGVTEMVEVEQPAAHAEDRVTLRLVGESDTDLVPAVYDLAVAQGWAVRELRQEVQTLESVFNRLALEVDPDDLEYEDEDQLDEELESPVTSE